MYSYTHSLTSTLDGGECSTSRFDRFTPREGAPGTLRIGGWVGPRAVLDAVVKRKIPSPRRESNPRTPIVQPVAQRYTDWAITALTVFTRARQMRPCVNFLTSSFLYGEVSLAPRPTPKMEDHSLSAVCYCLFNIFAATLHSRRPSPPSAPWGRVMPW
jgi:hypothetical protein